MRPEERRQISRLFTSLEYGEQLAYACAKQQHSVMHDVKSRRFLRAQAHQEYTHAAFFRTAVRCLTPKHQQHIPNGLKRFGERLHQAIVSNDLTDSLVGSQIVLEGFGEQILLRLNRGMDNRNIGFQRQRAILLRQEQSHFAFGMRILQRQINQEQTTVERVHALTEDYLQQVQQIIREMEGIFTVLDENAEEYTAGLIDSIPPWMLGDKI